MGLYIERGGGPSRLDTLLASHRKDKDGHTIITPIEAAGDLIDVLYALYKDQVSKSVLLGENTDVRIEGLRRVAGSNVLDNEEYDLTDTIEAIKQERVEALRLEEVRKQREIQTPPKPLRPII